MTIEPSFNIPVDRRSDIVVLYNARKAGYILGFKL